MSCHVMSCHVKSRHVTSCHVMSCHVMSCHDMFAMLAAMLICRQDTHPPCWQACRRPPWHRSWEQWMHLHLLVVHRSLLQQPSFQDWTPCCASPTPPSWLVWTLDACWCRDPPGSASRSAFRRPKPGRLCTQPAPVLQWKATVALRLHCWSQASPATSNLRFWPCRKSFPRCVHCKMQSQDQSGSPLQWRPSFLSSASVHVISSCRVITCHVYYMSCHVRFMPSCP